MEMQSHETASDESVFNISEDISEAPGEYPEASAGINAIHELIDSSDKSSPNCESETPISETQTAPPPVVDIEPHNDSCPVKKSTPYPSYLDQIDAYNEFPAHSQHAIRAMELAKHYKMDIVDIAKEINEPLIWIRKVMLSAMALSLMRGDKIDDASRVETLMGIEFNVIQCIQRMLVFQKMLDPISRDMERWVKNNLSQQDLDLLLSLVEANQNDFPHLLKGEAPPPGTKRYQKLPDSYKDRLQVCIAVFRELRDHTKNDRFNSGAAKQLTGHLNKNVIVINEIFDGLRERNLL
jgi:hypothetical protein